MSRGETRRPRPGGGKHQGAMGEQNERPESRRRGSPEAVQLGRPAFLSPETEPWVPAKPAQRGDGPAAPQTGPGSYRDARPTRSVRKTPAELRGREGSSAAKWKTKEFNKKN